MSDRGCKFVLLCEDRTHERFFKAYLKQCRDPNPERNVRPLVASLQQHGGNVGWVLDQFPSELQACRNRRRQVRELLVVLVDADDYTVERRRGQLLDRLKQTRHEEFGVDEPAMLLIPRRHIETWICALLGETVTEEDDCKRHKEFKKDELRQAAQTLHKWSRPNATPGPTCVPSLEIALPDWHRIG